MTASLIMAKVWTCLCFCQDLVSHPVGSSCMFLYMILLHCKHIAVWRKFQTHRNEMTVWEEQDVHVSLLTHVSLTNVWQLLSFYIVAIVWGWVEAFLFSCSEHYTWCNWLQKLEDWPQLHYWVVWALPVLQLHLPPHPRESYIPSLVQPGCRLFLPGHHW